MSPPFHYSKGSLDAPHIHVHCASYQHNHLSSVRESLQVDLFLLFFSANLCLRTNAKSPVSRTHRTVGFAHQGLLMHFTQCVLWEVTVLLPRDLDPDSSTPSWMEVTPLPVTYSVDSRCLGYLYTWVGVGGCEGPGEGEWPGQGGFCPTCRSCCCWAHSPLDGDTQLRVSPLS